MATSLAQQLKQLKAKASFIHTLPGSDHARASILFDAGEAAKYDRETFFDLGVSGLEELIAIDGVRFSRYEETLFNRGSISVERTTQDREVNAALDAEIRQFLVDVSPYLLLSASRRALEWLIHRYRIHEFNRDELIMTALLYHDTALFVVILKLMIRTLEDPTNKWNWLHNCAIKGVALTRSVLLNHCRKDVGFLSLVCNNAFTHIEVLGFESRHVRLAVGMFAVSCLGVLENRADVTERVLATLVPLLERGLKSRSADLRAASCMVFSQLSVVVTLEPGVVNALLEKLTKNISGPLVREILCCLSVVVRNQKVETLSKKCVQHVWRVSSLSSIISSLSLHFDLSLLIQLIFIPMVTKAVTKGTDVAMTTDGSDVEDVRPQYFDLLVGLLEEVNVCAKVSTALVRQILCELIKKRKELKTNSDKHTEWKHCARKLLTIIDRRTPSALESCFSELQKNETTLDEAQELSTLTLMPVKYTLLPDLSTNLLLGLSHPRSSTRFYAIKHLIKLLESGNLEDSNLTEEFVSEKLLERLEDDDVSVVRAVLDMKQNLVKFVEPHKLGVTLLKLTEKCNNGAEWSELMKRIMVVLCNKSLLEVDNGRVVIELLPWLLVTKGDTDKLKHCHVILKGLSDQVKSLPLLSSLNTKETERRRFGEFSLRITQDLAQSLVVMSDEYFKQTVDCVTRVSSLSSSKRFFCAMLLTTSLDMMLSSKHCRERILYLCNTLYSILSQEKYKKHNRENDSDESGEGQTKCSAEENSAENMSRWLKQLNKRNRLPVHFVQYALDTTLKSLKSLHAKADDVYENAYTTVVQSFLELLVQNLQKHFAMKAEAMLDKKSLLKVLCRVWCQYLKALIVSESTSTQQASAEPSTRLICLTVEMTDRLCSVNFQSLNDIINDEVVRYLLLLLLYSDDSDVRTAVVECLTKLYKTCRAEAAKFCHLRLLKRISKKKEELTADGNYILEIISSVYSSVDEEQKNSDLRKSLQSLLECLVTDKAPDYVMTGVLALLTTTKNKLVFESVTLLGLSTLTHLSLSDLDLVILKYSLERLDSGTAADLVDLNKPAVKLLVKALGYSGGGSDVEGQGEEEPMNEGVESIRTVRSSPQILTAEQLGRKFYHAVPSVEVQKHIVSVLLNTHQMATDSTTASALIKCLKKLKLNYVHLCHELNVGVSSAADLKSTPRTRKRVSAGSTVRVAIDYRRLVVVLEVIQARHDRPDSVDMCTALFSLLSRLVLDTEESIQESCDYCKQVILTSIYNICVRWRVGPENNRPKQQEIIKMDAVVECLRGATSAQTERQALLVVTALAPLFPDYILHNVMPVFTFMGTSLMQRDDSHSFQVIMQTIDSVIPAILQSTSQGSSAVTSGRSDARLQSTVTSILRVFVDARHFIPRHRRLPLFTRILATVGVENNLWRMLVLTIESAVQTRPVAIGKVATGEASAVTRSDVTQDSEFSDERQAMISRDIEYSVSISSEFSAHDQLQSMIYVVQFLQQLLSAHISAAADMKMPTDSADNSDERVTPGTKRKSVISSICKKRKVEATGTDSTQVVDLGLINIGKLSGQQVRLLQYHLSRLVVAVLSSNQLITEILSLPSTLVGTVISRPYDGSSEADSKSQSERGRKTERLDLSLVFRRLVDETLCYMTRVTRLSGQQSGGAGREVGVGGEGAAVTAKFWKALLQRIYDVLDKVNYLLPSSSFLDVVLSLLDHSSASVRHKSMDLLNTKLQSLSAESLSDNEVERLLSLVERLLDVVRADEDSADNDVITNRQMALYSIKLLSRLLAASHPQSFTQIFSVVVPVLRDSSNIALRCNAMLCVAELCACLRAHSIQHLPLFMPPLLSVLNDKHLLISELALVCVISTVQKIVFSLPHFISPYVIQIIMAICELDSSGVIERCSKRALGIDKFKILCVQVSTLVSSRVFVPNAVNAFSELIKSNQNGIVSLMSLMKQHLEVMSKEEMNAHQSALSQFFSLLLDIRNTATQLDWDCMDKCEDSLIETILSLVIRLSENSFRPLFYKLYDWSCREDSMEYRNRRLTFYRLVDRLAGRLKSVFILFVGHIVKSGCQTLEANNSAHTLYYEESSEGDAVRKSCQLISYVLGCLHKCLLYDSGHSFVDSYTSIIMQPIIDQLENFIGGNEAYESRVSDHLVPCLGQLAVSARETSAWKSLNYQVCLKTRSSAPKVRFATLKAIEEMALKLGDGYEALLPETMPFLAELLEDDSEEVEQECQRVKQTMEELLGESLTKYF